MKNEIIHGDCISVMSEMPDDSIHLIVTSPPYFLNKVYERSYTLGDYVTLMESFFIEAERVLVPGRYLVINFGDYFNSGNRFYEADVPACYPASINYYHWGVESAQMDLQATRIWRKQFARMGIPFVCNKHPRPVFDYEHIWTFRKRNGSKEEFVNDRKLSQRGVIGENWTSPAGLAKHCAAFPVELPLWAIDVYSGSENDVILDPFGGSGTVGIACKQRGRKYIIIEKDYEFFKLCQKRVI